MPAGVSPTARESQLRFLDDLNAIHGTRHAPNSELDARISNYELAARMQTAVPKVLDISNEPAETRRLYGLDDPATAEPVGIEPIAHLDMDSDKDSGEKP
jgi:hypothetical protein